ncbi:Linoleate 13S-lipoxygenase 2-1, chloroplastic [Linum perenne]
MLKPHLQTSSRPPVLIPSTGSSRGRNYGRSHVPLRPSMSLSPSNNIRVAAGSNNSKPPASREVSSSAFIGGSTTEQAVKVKAVVTVKQPAKLLSKIGIGMEDISSFFGKTFQLKVVSTQLDPETGLEQPSVKAHAKKVSEHGGEIKYEAEFKIPDEFGEVGGVVVVNEHPDEMFLKNIVLDGFVTGPVNVPCDSWVQPKSHNSSNRIFFTTKSYLPTETPDGLTRYRKEELNLLRGNGQGQRKKGERIYDYDVYNDLGNPDKNSDLARPVLGGKANPYPRRCRTGRPRTKKDPKSETRSAGEFYVPRDEEFSEVKDECFNRNTFSSVLHAVVPAMETLLIDPDLGFPHFAAIDALFDQGLDLPPRAADAPLTDILPRLVRTAAERSNDMLQFELPTTMERDRFFWLKDEQFGRQTVAGVNPCCIELVKEWPLKSKLDPKIYGPPESAITTAVVERQIKGFSTIDEAMKQNKLFILDYHDLLLPFVSLIRQQEGTVLYGSRALFFLTPIGTLKPIAIELTRPPMDGKPQWKEVYTPTLCSSTDQWLWKLAKTHVLANDVGYHQLVSHWLRTHCCTEPYIIAANRQLSAMHPIYRLLLPHFRYTMEINALARQSLINAGGIIESCFGPLKHAIQLSSAVYDQNWRFDYEALPNDLIRRGMAVEDPSAPHGLKLTIEDYPYASDGLIMWDALKEWVTNYVDRYYPDPSLVASDSELQAWWTEVRTVGHQDKKDEPWWPTLKTPSDLVGILTTIMWVASGHHAAVNFGQYAFGGYLPNRPTIGRKKMPNEDGTVEEWKRFLEKPETVLLEMYPSQLQASKVMAVLDVLSGHSTEEEYLGKEMEQAWADDPLIKSAFEKFSGRMMQLEGEIDARNANPKLRNRNGAGVLPYELLKPFSEPGVTGKGVPYSISI